MRAESSTRPPSSKVPLASVNYWNRNAVPTVHKQCRVLTKGCGISEAGCTAKFFLHSRGFFLVPPYVLKILGSFSADY